MLARALRRNAVMLCRRVPRLPSTMTQAVLVVRMLRLSSLILREPVLALLALRQIAARFHRVQRPRNFAQQLLPLHVPLLVRPKLLIPDAPPRRAQHRTSKMEQHAAMLRERLSWTWLLNTPLIAVVVAIWRRANP